VKLVVIAIAAYAALPAVIWLFVRRKGPVPAKDAAVSGVRSWIRPYASTVLLLLRHPDVSTLTHRLRMAEMALRGERGAQERLILRVAEMLASVHLLSAAGMAAGAAMGDPAPALAMLVLAVLLPCYQYQTIMRRVEWRKRQIMLELPLVINKMVLLLQSGEPLMRALQAAASATDRPGHPLYAELREMLAHWQHHQSFAAAVERFSRRCAVHEASVFANSLMMNYRRGGDDLVHSLRLLGAELWSRRKAMARTLGEEASAKLVLPMVVMFFTVMVIVAAPAFFHMS
jgi:tight adherence protein C